jgi:HlyD family secretion protein
MVVTQEDVNNGLVLVELDASTLKDDLTRQEVQLSRDMQSLIDANETYKIQVKQNESDIAKYEMNVRFALMDLQKYLGRELADKMVKDVNGASNLSEYLKPFIQIVREDPNILAGSGASQQFKKFNDDIIIANGNLTTAEATLKGTVRLHDANYVSDLDLQRDTLSVVSRKITSDSSKVALDLFLKYDVPKNAEQYLSDYIEANRALERTYSACRSMLAQAQAKLSTAEQSLQTQQEYVDDLKKQIEYCTIKAKAPGLVIYGTGGSGDIFRAMRGGSGSRSGIIAEGETVSEGQTIISMPNTNEMVAEISVHETEVDKIRPGQPATIIMDAFPDTVLQGKVLEVAPLPDEQRGWMNPDMKVYKTLVIVNGTHDFLKTRMSCRVTIFVDQLKDVVVVPIQVVANRGGKKVCYIMTANGPEERDVQTGLFNDTFVQIASGINEGEQVMLNPPLFSETTAEVAMTAEQQTQLQSQPQLPPNGLTSDTPRQGQGQRRQMDFSRMELTDEMADKIMEGLSQSVPDKYQELQKLRTEDPNKFKTELRNVMREQMSRMGGRSRQGGGQGAEGGLDRQDSTGMQGGENRQGGLNRQGDENRQGGLNRQGTSDRQGTNNPSLKGE